MVGQRLYVDIVELNPPLVFYVYAALSLGTFSKPMFIGGVIGAMVISSLWAVRLRGPRWGVATFIVVVAAGIADFGQRDHLAAIVAIPYLFADRAAKRERFLIGAWSFIGFGLKPYFLLIPAAATLGRMLQQRSFKPAFSPENLALAIFCLGYVVASVLLHPEYFEDRSRSRTSSILLMERDRASLWP